MVFPTGSDPSHHVGLTDGVITVGCVLTGPDGERNERNLRRSPFADPQQPYATATQRDWSLGFGTEKFEDNRSAYWNGHSVDPTKSGAVTLGPLFRYAKGHRKADFHQPVGAFIWADLYGDARFRGMRFVASDTYSPAAVRFWVKTVGTPLSLTVKIMTDVGGFPSATLASATVGTYYYDATEVKVSIAPGSLASGTPYWVVWDGTSQAHSESKWMILATPTGGTGKYSSNGTSWTSTTHSYSFRLTEPDKAFTPHFYEYRGQLYAALEYDDGTTAKILMNGWRGAADTNGGQLGRLNDSTQTGWATRNMSGMVARMVAGQTTGELEDYRVITGQASGYVSVSPSWDIIHNTTDDYVITGSDEWFVIPQGSVLTGRVTDVVVAEGIVYLMRGSSSNIVMHREYNKNGVWTADTSSDSWAATMVAAQFGKAIDDPVSGPVIWFGINPGIGGKSKPEVWKALPPGSWDYLALNRTVIATDTQPWTAATADVERQFISPPVSENVFIIKIGRVTTINATPTAGGTGYTVNDVLTINQTGSGLNATVTVTAVTGGVVTAVSLTTGGYGYTTGTGKPTTGGTGTGCTVEITGISSFGTGVFAYVNIGATDLRQVSEIRFAIWSDTDLSLGDIDVVLDDTPNVASPIVALSAGRMNKGVLYPLLLQMDISTVAGANAIVSIGLRLNASKAATTTIKISRPVLGYDRFPPIFVGDEADNLTGMETYGDPETLWVMTETGIGAIDNNVYVPAPLRELAVARHPANGKAHTVHDVYLMFSWRGKLQRYFRQNLENLGPEYPIDLGSIRGQIVAVQTYAGRVYVAVDGGPSKPSQVMTWKGSTWHEVYTGWPGDRIRSMYIQAIPGKSDRLWIGIGSDIGWLPLALDPVNIPSDSDYNYAYEGYIEMPYIHGDREDLDKLFKSVIIYADGLDSTKRIALSYKIGTGVSYVAAGDVYRGLHPEILLNLGRPPNIYGVTASRLRMKLRLTTLDTTKTPILRGTTVKLYTIPEVKYGYAFLTKLSSLSINLRGDEEKALGVFDTPSAALAQLDTWASSMTPLRLVSDLTILKDRVVVLEPVPAQLLISVADEKMEEDIVQISCNDL